MRLPPVIACAVAVAMLTAGTALAQFNSGSTVRFVQPVQVKHAVSSQTAAKDKTPAVPGDEIPLLPIIDNFLGYDNFADDQVSPRSNGAGSYQVHASGRGASCAGAAPPAARCPAPQPCCDAGPCKCKKGLLEWLGLDCHSCKPACCNEAPCGKSAPCCKPGCNSKKAPCCRKQYKSLIELLGLGKKCHSKSSPCGCDGHPHDCACDGTGHPHDCGSDAGHAPYHGSCGCDASLAHQRCGCDSGPAHGGPGK